MNPATRELVAAIHHANVQFVVTVTGGGAKAVSALLGVPGASRTILEAVVPYHENALVDFLGFRPAHFCASETGAALARRARMRATWLAPHAPVAGVGCTASLVSDRPHRGDHRFHVAVETAERRLSLALTLAKGARDREGEEAVVDAVLLNAMAEIAGIAPRLELPLQPGEVLERAEEKRADALAELIRGEIPAVRVSPDGKIGPATAPAALLPPAALLSGAFNPVHAGHWKMAEVAGRLSGLPVAFELSIVNVDKPALAREEVERRLGPFAWRASIWLTRSPTFVEKARLFPGTMFVVGADTAERIVMPRYYGDSAERMVEALTEIQARGCRFLVAGRADDAGTYRCLERTQIPAGLQDVFVAIAQSDFRHDISSTQLRT
jgi:hypothetical protein